MSDFSCIVRAIVPARKGQLSSQLMHDFAQSTLSNVFFRSLFWPLFEKNETSENGRRKWGRSLCSHHRGTTLVDIKPVWKPKASVWILPCLEAFCFGYLWIEICSFDSTESADEICALLPKLADVKLVLLWFDFMLILFDIFFICECFYDFVLWTKT